MFEKIIKYAATKESCPYIVTETCKDPALERKMKMEEMNKENQTEETVLTPEAANAPEKEEQPAAEKPGKKSFWAARKERKRHYKQLRKELRRNKREAYRAKTFLGKLGFLLGKVVKLVCILLLVITVARVHYKEIGTAALSLLMGGVDALVSTVEVTPEQIQEIAPVDSERGNIIDGSAPLEEGETWAIYLYMVGSDLESSSTEQISETANYVIQKEATPLAQERNALDQEHMNALIDNVLENGMDLPNSMYEKTVYSPVERFGLAFEDVLYEIQSNMGDYHAASADISEIMEVTLPENVKLVIQPGGAGCWNHSMINPNRTQRFLYDSEGMHKVYEGHISNMGNPQTLVDFLTYCEEEYPADHTMVLFWNHGGGAFGFGWDQLYQDDNLSLEELRWAFEQVYTANEAEPAVDIIGFDACLMASMEVAETFHGFGRYLLASEEVEPGFGWDYTAWLNKVAENPRLNAQQMCKAVADSYMDFYARSAAAENSSSAEVYSVLDLQYADDLYSAYSDFAAAALQESSAYPGTAAYIGKIANSSIKYAQGYADIYNTVDLGLFMEGMDQILPEESQAILKILDKMVLYNRTGNDLKDSTGITVYYPGRIQNFRGLNFAVRYINQICKDPDIQALYYYKVAGCLTEPMREYLSQQGYDPLMPMDTTPFKQLQKEDVTLLEDGNMGLAVPEDVAMLTQESWYNLLQIQEDGSALRLGYDSYLVLDENNQLQSAYEGDWAQIDGVLLPMEVVSASASGSIRYRTKVGHNGTDAYLLTSIDLETQQRQILGIQPCSDTSDNTVLVDRNTRDLKPGDILKPIYEQYDIHTGVGTEIYGKEIIYREDTEVVDAKLPDGSYMSYISFMDARGDVYDMQVVSFTMENATMGNGQIVKMP